ncbi:MAG: PTS sugar transporter subunit IIA [Proteobacteria bacterium]|nr:PTS sugar transporter subunit IIA [Pseudomonadota bacterium]
MISPNAVITHQEIKSKKRALEVLAEKLAAEARLPGNTDPGENDTEVINPLDIFKLLTEREKLGSTGMGHGVALPHARTSLTDTAVGAFIKLDKGIDFDSPDQQPTDLIFALMVPEHFTDEHLKILAYLASLFSDESFCQNIRNATEQDDIYDKLLHWHLSSQAS